MNEIFGISMTSIVIVLLSMLALCLLTVAWVALRRPVIFKMGMRNIPRRQAQTVLIVVGLMLSTMIMSAALGTGDTIDYSMTNDVYDTFGHVDTQVIASQSVDPGIGVGQTQMSASNLATIQGALSGDTTVDGVMPELREVVPVVNEAKQLAEPSVNLVGLDPSMLGGFGEIKSTAGESIDLLTVQPGSVLLNERAATELDAQVGDTLTVFVNNQPTSLTVQEIVQNTYITGGGRDFNSGVEVSGMVMPLAQAQELLGLPETITAVLISNAGGVRDSLDASTATVERLQPTLEGTGLGAIAIKSEWVDLGRQFGQIFTGLFLVLGLFSIAAGILLIVLIFTMLAAERRAEMGMARAVGTHRRQLIQQFISEGSGYAIIAGFVGSALGVLAAVGIGYAMGFLFGDFLNITPHVTLRSLIAAYCLGVVITFLAVVGSSWKISRLNVVAAIRDIPDASSPTRKKRTLVWAALLLLAGGAFTLSGINSEGAFPFYAGMSLLPFGVALILRFFGVPSRPIYSAIGIYLVVFWLLPDDQFEKIFGNFDGGIEMFFLSGIFMVIGATILIVQNTDLLLKGVSAMGGIFKSKLPAIRTAVAYPGASRGRTGLTIAMFSLIIFSLVMIATMNQNYVNLYLGDDANAGWQVQASASSANPITDFTGTLQAAGVDTNEFQAVGVLSSPDIGSPSVRIQGQTEWSTSGVYGQDSGFISNATLKFGQRAAGYDTDEAIVNALLNEPNVAVVDASMLDGQDGFGGNPDALILEGVTSDDKVFQPVTLEIADPVTGQPSTVKVIGVLDSKISILFGIFTSDQTISTLFPDSPLNQSFFVQLKDADQSTEIAKQVESALLRNGVQAVSIQDVLEDNQRQSTGFLYIIQGFMGLGLIVGIAAIGVIAFRSVVERRQQIGVLRAIGYQQGMVSLSFMIETAFVVGIGSISGTLLGVLLARNLFTSDAQATDVSFLVPYGLISVILIATIAVSLLMTWVPSRQAARISPAEALRYE